MGGGSAAKEHPGAYFLASALSATVNYPLWRASAMSQSGFAVSQMQVAGLRIPAHLSPYVYAFLPPYKGMVATVGGMTWARAAIFWGSDYGRHLLRARGYPDSVATLVPPLVTSTGVQMVNMPLVRATITIQDPQSGIHTVPASLKHIYQTRGLAGLWHGTYAGILKTVPKYCTAICVKDFMEEWLPLPDPQSPTLASDRLWRSACKSAVAGVAGAVLTNPLDVIRNEQFKTDLGLVATVRHLHETTGWQFLTRGMTKNMIAVAIPVGCTIFFTDALIQLSNHREKRKTESS